MAEKKRDLGEIFAEAAQDKGPVQAEKQSLGEILYQALGKVWDGAVPMFEHGSTELMSTAYTGNAYVPYGWSGVEPGVEQENDGHGLAEEIKEVEKDRGLER